MSNDAARRPLTERDMLDRLVAAATRYRESYEDVEKAIAREKHPDLPTWVFGLENFNLDALRDLSPAIAQAEQRRRASRAALHAVVELAALEDPGAALASQPAMAAAATSATDVGQLAELGGDDPNWARVLDRFIGIVHYADDHGCLYINGTFEPILQHEDLDATEVTNVRDLGPIE